ncbi:hypothetical protein PGKDCPLP_02474 [Stenotrophomonas maltophilia]|nr:hypothetical protein PGKDCPLP_02474 [Stenotrophomonas maltophilia]
MPGRFQAKLCGDACQQRVMVVVALQQRAQRHAELAEQAQPQVALGGHPQAVAALAEVARIRGDDADAAAMVGVAELACRAGIGRARTLVPASGQQLLDHHVGTQVVALEIGFVVAGAHQFDEAHAEGAVTQVVHPLRQLVVVQAAQQHRVELDRRQAKCLCQGQALFDLRQAVMPGDGLEAFALQAVHAHVQRGQASPVPTRQAPR